VAERYVVLEPLLRRAPEAIHPVTRAIIERGAQPSAADAFRAQYRLQALRRITESVWNDVDVLLTPTTGTIHRITDVEADPIRLNTQLGFYTNFANLLDLAAVAVPAGFTASGLPFGVTLLAPAWSDYELLALAARMQPAGDTRASALDEPQSDAAFDWPAVTGRVPLAVCGAHLDGLPLNGQLRERGGILIERTRTAPCYRLYALPGGPPQRPGLVRMGGGCAIEVEVWSLPAASVGSFIVGIPAPLAIGKVQLQDGRQVSGFVCEANATKGAEDISVFGGWRAYLNKG
jgi:allophanate hydrolase